MSVDKLIKTLSKSVKIPEWVNAETQKLIDAADKLKTPDWVDGEVQKLKKAAADSEGKTGNEQEKRVTKDEAQRLEKA